MRERISLTGLLSVVILCSVSIVCWSAIQTEASLPEPLAGTTFRGWTLASEENFSSDLLPQDLSGVLPTTEEIIEKIGMMPFSSSLSASVMLPGAVDLLDHMPPAANQLYNECAAFSLAYYCISYWRSLHEGVGSVWENDELGSSLFLYNQCCGGYDRPIYLALPHSLSVSRGCAFLEDFNPPELSFLPGITEGKKAFLNVTDDQGYLYFSNNYEEPLGYLPGSDPLSPEELNSMKYCLREQMPLVAGIYIYPSFSEGTGLSPSSVYYGPERPYPEPSGYHAVTIAGYKNDPVIPGGGAFYLRNSWGKGWGANGDCWVSYDFIKNHSVEAYPVKVRRDYFPEYYMVLVARHPSRGQLEVSVEIDGKQVREYSPQLMAPDDERDDLKLTLDLSDFINSRTYSVKMKLTNYSTSEEGFIEEAYLVRGGSPASGMISSSAISDLDSQIEEAAPFDFGNDQKIPNDGSIEGSLILPYSDFNDLDVTDPDPPVPSVPDSSGGGGGCSISSCSTIFISMISILVLLVSGK